MLELHLIPGTFSESGRRAVALLAGPGAVLQAVNLDAPEGRSGREAAEWLAAADRGERRRATGRFRLPGGRAHPMHVETMGAAPDSRLIVALGVAAGGVDGSEETQRTLRDIELALLGFAFQVLSREEDGAVFIGAGIGRAGAGLPRGPLREQVGGFLDVHGDAIEVAVLTASTDDAAGARFAGAGHRETRGNLVVYRL